MYLVTYGFSFLEVRVCVIVKLFENSFIVESFVLILMNVFDGMLYLLIYDIF